MSLVVRDGRVKEEEEGGSTYPYCSDMLSTPAPMPTSIMPALIWLATSTQAWRPEEHWRLRVRTAVDSGKPATRLAPRISVAPPPGARTEPTQMSSTRAGLMWERSMMALRTPAMMSAACVSLKPPLPPLVKALRQQAVTTTSSGRFSSILSRPPAVWLPESWAPICEILSRARMDKKHVCQCGPWHGKSDVDVPPMVFILFFRYVPAFVRWAGGREEAWRWRLKWRNGDARARAEAWRHSGGSLAL